MVVQVCILVISGKKTFNTYLFSFITFRSDVTFYVNIGGYICNPLYDLCPTKPEMVGKYIQIENTFNLKIH